MGRPSEGNLNKLLLETCEAYYWIGYLMADGSFDFDRNKIKLVQAGKNKEQVRQFANFIKCRNVHSYRVKTAFGSISDVLEVGAANEKMFPKIVKKFGIKPFKTTHPCNLSWINKVSDRFFISFFIGFVDGDGCISYQTRRKDCSIHIKIHSSWKKNLQKISNRLCKIIQVRPNKILDREYAVIVFSNSIILKYLKNHITKSHLPVLERKWNKIDVNFISRQELGKQRIIKAKEMMRQGISKKEMALRLKISLPGIYQILWRLKHG